MTALALFLILVSAKLAAIGGHGIPLSAWSLVAYAWQDAVVAATFGTLHHALAGRRGGRPAMAALFWGLVVYAAINIPIGRVLATPLTWPMLRATRGALADSVLLYLTWTNAILMLSIVGAAAALPRLLGRLPQRLPRRAALCVIPLAALGLFGSSRVDAHGRHRNALVALVQSGFPQVRPHASGNDWRTSPFEHGKGDDLSRLRGTARGRNVIVVSLESTAAQYLPLRRGGDEVMPVLAALARESIVFDQAYAAYPESIKGLFSTLCSTFPAFDVDPETLSRVPCQALPALLRKAGYATGLFHSGRFDYLGMQAVIDNRGYDALEDAGDIGGNHRSSFGVDEPSTVSRMLAWVDALPPNRPFLLTYLPIAGHHPYEAPTPGTFSNDSEFGRYQNALRYGDASLGALVEGLRERGRQRDTLWIIFGDHGEAFGQHPGNYGHTFFLYQENVRVPFIIAAPGVLRAQIRVDRVVSLVDVAPTVLDLLGMPVPTGYQGRSVLDGTPRMALFFTDYSLPLAGLVDRRWKVVHELNTGRTRIFDLTIDPGETDDLAARFPARSAWYAERLRGWTSAQKHYVLTAATANRTDDDTLTIRGSGP